ncbi:MAG: cation:proton antiporter [Nitrospinota bacterium]
MTQDQFLRDLIVLLTATLPVSYLCHKFRLPALMGYLLTGMLIGPFGAGFIHDSQEVKIMAEIGVVMLLFTIGLEFSLERIMKNMRSLLLCGGLQVLSSIFGTLLLALFLGFGLSQGLFFGFLVSLSSTAIILRLYTERGEVNTPHGKAVVGILLFQDLCVVPMIFLIPILASNPEDSFTPLLLAVLKAIGGVGLIFFSARLLIPSALHHFARLKNRETMTLLVILLCIGIAFFTEKFGVSLAMGAFIAGLIISESEYSQQIVVEVMPFRDFFSSIFFISIGMFFHFSLFYQNITTVLLLVGALVVLKSVLAFGSIWLAGNSLRISFVSSLRLAQVGEFSFIMAGTGLGVGLISETEFNVFISIAILSMFITPLLIQASGVLPYWIFPGIRDREKRWEEESSGYEGHVIICGYGLNGKNLTRVLKETRVKYLVVDINADHLKEAHAQGVDIMYGDVTRREILLKAGIKKAKIIVFAISDHVAARRGVGIARKANPDIFMLVRTENASEVDDLIKLGADQVIPMEFETSVEIFSRVLKVFNIPENIINQYIEMIRTEGYGMLRGLSMTQERLRDLYGYLAKSTTTNHLVMEETPADGNSLIGLNLRQHSGAVILAIVRGREYFSNPEPGFAISAGDLLVIAGSHAQLDRAQKFLSGKTENTN